MDKQLFKMAIAQYSYNSKIALHQLTGYLTDARLIEIIKIYDKLKDGNAEEVIFVQW